MEFKESKRIVREYLRSTYTDRDLVRALDHAREGKLSWMSCCCFSGIPMATGELHGFVFSDFSHLVTFGSDEEMRASDAYYLLQHGDFDEESQRRRILIPMILAEIRRRTRAIAERAQQPEPCMACVEER